MSACHCLVAQIEQLAQRWSSPGGVGQWHWGQSGKPCDRDWINLAQRSKAALGSWSSSCSILSSGETSTRQLGCSRQKFSVAANPGSKLLFLGRCQWAVEKRISSIGLGSFAFNFSRIHWRLKVSVCAQAALEVATDIMSRWIDTGRVWAATVAPTTSGQNLSKCWNGCHSTCSCRATIRWSSDLKDISKVKNKNVHIDLNQLNLFLVMEKGTII